MADGDRRADRDREIRCKPRWRLHGSRAAGRAILLTRPILRKGGDADASSNRFGAELEGRRVASPPVVAGEATSRRGPRGRGIRWPIPNALKIFSRLNLFRKFKEVAKLGD